MSARGDLERVVRHAKARGWEEIPRTTRGHRRLRWKDGSVVLFSPNSADFYALKNMIADLKRYEEGRVPA